MQSFSRSSQCCTLSHPQQCWTMLCLSVMWHLVMSVPHNFTKPFPSNGHTTISRRDPNSSTCQMTKKGKGCGHKIAAVDLIGPQTMCNQEGNAHTFTALTMIGTVTTCCEIIPIWNKTAAHVGSQLENQWLSRCPKPHRCAIHDQGNKFLGETFQSMLTVESMMFIQQDRRLRTLCETLCANDCTNRWVTRDTVRALNHDIEPHASKKLNTPYKGPCAIESIHMNGTVTMRLPPNHAKRLNVRQLKPHNS